jgi:hypothetical protein
MSKHERKIEVLELLNDYRDKIDYYINSNLFDEYFQFVDECDLETDLKKICMLKRKVEIFKLQLNQHILSLQNKLDEIKFFIDNNLVFLITDVDLKKDTIEKEASDLRLNDLVEKLLQNNKKIELNIVAKSN